MGIKSRIKSFSVWKNWLNSSVFIIVNFTHFNINETLQRTGIYDILEDKNGTIWFATSSQGIIKYEDNSFTLLTEKEGLSSNVVVCLLEDDLGNLWIGTIGGGLCR